MFQLRCTVRHCNQPLERNDRGLTCSAGHHFDRAKQGYWNLLQPQDRKSKHPGDAESAVRARARWLAGGYATGLVEALRPWTIADAHEKRRIMDLGCGEGSLGKALFSQASLSYCGVELSKHAIKLAARTWPAATWVLANADRVLPAADHSVDCVVSLFGRRPVTEIARVLAPAGHCVVAVPGAEDLVELRASVQQAAHRRRRWEAIAEQFAAAGLELVQQRGWLTQVQLQPEAIADALAMTYRGARHSQRSRADRLPAMMVTLAADLIYFQRR